VLKIEPQFCKLFIGMVRNQLENYTEYLVSTFHKILQDLLPLFSQEEEMLTHFGGMEV
jgi:hypothetical protein